LLRQSGCAVLLQNAAAVRLVALAGLDQFLGVRVVHDTQGGQSVLLGGDGQGNALGGDDVPALTTGAVALRAVNFLVESQADALGLLELTDGAEALRSEERRVGNEGGSTRPCSQCTKNMCAAPSTN